MNAFVTAGAGFLLAVLWFDLMFDVQARGKGTDELAEPVLASIAAYYARVTTAARPMNRLIAAVMLATIAAIVVQLAAGTAPSWAAWVSLVFTVGPVMTAATRTVPAAVRLGGRADSAAEQSRLARAIRSQHLFCFASIATVVVVQLSAF